jgi:hypothetical protein
LIKINFIIFGKKANYDKKLVFCLKQPPPEDMITLFNKKECWWLWNLRNKETVLPNKVTCGAGRINGYERYEP